MGKPMHARRCRMFMARLVQEAVPLLRPPGVPAGDLTSVVPSFPAVALRDFTKGQAMEWPMVTQGSENSHMTYRPAGRRSGLA
jgi:hypothetical protein